MKDMDQAMGLPRAECLHLMSTVTVGRLVFTEQALPAVMPVGFVLDHADVVIPLPQGSGLIAATRDAIVAFEVDDLDALGRNGWSVTAVGRAHVVSDPGDRVREALRPWTEGLAGAEFLRVSSLQVKGTLLGSTLAANRKFAA
ncbi:pyridoxamine 5'-phosphate oxidase family protein [Actinomadura madurae]|uniref:pyridoxamine 5'-phosphate oxidase family protein n=2 Tax=Actinomadura madurae TaxID=1993 RepID=UPI002026F091|nr:pyridoxamine 5'-phosphate oxidase family protein [Actinomadura madurae]URM94580.1 pyridoxamine 5'-phosphate oxidase family protein [Actinomadura madurae]